MTALLYTLAMKRMSSAGRDAQRRRTRKAILATATELLARGTTPSVGEIARAAEVSRRTVYMYFPTLEQLLIDATAGAITSDAGIDTMFDERASTDVRSRVDALVHAVGELTDKTLPAGRRLIALTVESPPAPRTPATARRGRRRIAWIETALAPLRERLTNEQYERLVSALAVVIGWEAAIVLRDVQGLSGARETRVTQWAAAALVEAMVKEARSARRRRRSPRKTAYH